MSLQFTEDWQDSGCQVPVLHATPQHLLHTAYTVQSRLPSACPRRGFGTAPLPPACAALGTSALPPSMAGHPHPGGPPSIRERTLLSSLLQNRSICDRTFSGMQTSHALSACRVSHLHVHHCFADAEQCVEELPAALVFEDY